MWDSFMECVTFHLLMVFCRHVVEIQRYCISNCLKKPNRVPIRQFRGWVQQLNGYLHLLPCVFNSPKAMKLTKKVGPFDDTNLVSCILSSVPGLGRPITNSRRTQSPRVSGSFGSTRTHWEGVPTDCKQPSKKGKENHGNSNKCKMVSFTETIPKKNCQDGKHCVMHKKYVGMHAAQNMSDCCKYENEKYSTHKKGFWERNLWQYYHR